MAEQWYVARGKEKFGLFSAVQLKQMASQGRLLPSDMLHKEGMPKWVAASSVKGLFPAPVRPAAAKPPAPNDSDFRFNAADSPKERRTQPSSRKKLLMLGAAGGGVLLAILVVVLVVAGRGRTPARGNAGDAGSVQKAPQTSEARQDEKLGQDKTPEAQDSQGDILAGHTGIVRGVAFSPDGKWLATTANDKTTRVWDVAAKKTVYTLPRSTAQYRAGQGVPPTFSPNSQYLATTDSMSEVAIWDMNNGRKVRSVPNTATNIFTPDSQQVLAVIQSGDDPWKFVVALLDLTTGAKKVILPSVPGLQAISSAAFSPDGTLILADGFWNAITMKPVQIERGKDRFDATGVNFGKMIFSRDSKLLATFDPTGHGGFQLFDIRQGKLVFRANGFNMGAIVGSAAFSPDGKRLAQTVGILKFVTSKSSAKRGGFGAPVTSHKILVWDTEGGGKKPLMELSGGSYVLFSPDGTKIASPDANEGKDVVLWNSTTGDKIAVLHGHTEPITIMLFSPDGSLLATKAGVAGSKDKTVRLWRVPSGMAGTKPPPQGTAKGKDTRPADSGTGSSKIDDDGERQSAEPLEKLIVGRWVQISGRLLAMNGRKMPSEVEYTDDGKYYHSRWFSKPWRWRYKFICKNQVRIMTSGTDAVYEGLVSKEQYEKMSPEDRSRLDEMVKERYKAPKDYTLTVSVDGDKLTEIRARERDGKELSRVEYKRMRKRR